MSGVARLPPGHARPVNVDPDRNTRWPPPAPSIARSASGSIRRASRSTGCTHRCWTSRASPVRNFWCRARCGKWMRAVGGIAERLSLESRTITPLVKRLEAAGFGGRARDPRDERHVRVTPADRGRAVQAECGCPDEALVAGWNGVEDAGGAGGRRRRWRGRRGARRLFLDPGRFGFDLRRRSRSEFGLHHPGRFGAAFGVALDRLERGSAFLLRSGRKREHGSRPGGRGGWVGAGHRLPMVVIPAFAGARG